LRVTKACTACPVSSSAVPMTGWMDTFVSGLVKHGIGTKGNSPAVSATPLCIITADSSQQSTNDVPKH
jgi:hypothetical protein